MKSGVLCFYEDKVVRSAVEQTINVKKKDPNSGKPFVPVHVSVLVLHLSKYKTVITFSNIS